MSEPDLNLKPLEIHANKKAIKSTMRVYSTITIFMACILLFVLLQWKKPLLILSLSWLTGWSFAETFTRYRNSRVIGPVFSFSKHGVIDHRGTQPRILRWNEIDHVSWQKGSSKSGRHSFLRIELLKITIQHRIASLFTYHPYRIRHSHISLENQFDPDKDLRAAVPMDKFQIEP